jgi:hypothetical protein
MFTSGSLFGRGGVPEFGVVCSKSASASVSHPNETPITIQCSLRDLIDIDGVNEWAFVLKHDATRRPPRTTDAVCAMYFANRLIRLPVPSAKLLQMQNFGVVVSEKDISIVYFFGRQPGMDIVDRVKRCFLPT